MDGDTFDTARDRPDDERGVRTARRELEPVSRPAGHCCVVAADVPLAIRQRIAATLAGG